ncbi:hypothetical protein [Methylorubrum sp. SB2]|uniref:hypothetical protein n=1 Tax=Methylorubrum subtropicum TaxID=3138812 RepID=UPI00313B90EF
MSRVKHYSKPSFVRPSERDAIVAQVSVDPGQRDRKQPPRKTFPSSHEPQAILFRLA